jgi:Mg-chelatase subunit ChlI
MMNRHMKRKLRALGLVAAMMVFSAQMATAAITSDSVIASYQAEGYTRIEVRIGPTQMKVEAIKGNVKVETIYDIATGTVLKTETEAVLAGENIAPGVSVRKRGQDFVDAGNSSDDDSNDDNDDDSSDDNDDDSSDDSDDDNDDDSSDDSDDDSSDDSDDDSDDDSSGHGGDDDRD